MIDIKFIKENVGLIKKNCINRHVKVDIDKLLKFDEDRRINLQKLEDLRAIRNKKSKGKPSQEDIVVLRKIGDDIKELENNQILIEKEYKAILLTVPNLTHPDTPIGGENDFKIIYENKKPQDSDFELFDHEKIMVQNNWIDFERGAKIASSKFYFVKNNLVRLNQALINYSFDVASKYGYELVETPDLAHNNILEGIGFNPRGEETQVYSIKNSDLSLIGTAEIPMGGYHSNEILDLENGPKKYIALSHCFRTEAGAYGRISKGLYRVHQFSKVEMFVFCKPEDNEKYHEEILSIEKEIVDGLEIPYRVIDIPTGDLGGPAYRKFDIEAWMVMKKEKDTNGGYGEITSCSNCTDYQSRRLNIKYRDKNGNLEYVHTLNGTAVVLSRFPLAIVENHQQKDGSVVVPKALQQYCGLKKL